MFSTKFRGLLVAIPLLLVAGRACPENGAVPAPPVLSAAQIVEQMQLHNQARNEELKH